MSEGEEVSEEVGPPVTSPLQDDQVHILSQVSLSDVEGLVILFFEGVLGIRKGAWAGLQLVQLGCPQASAAPLTPGSLDTRLQDHGGPLVRQRICLSPHQGPEPWGWQGVMVRERETEWETDPERTSGPHEMP